MNDRMGTPIAVDDYIRLTKWSGVQTNLYGQVIVIEKGWATVKWLSGEKSTVNYQSAQLLKLEPENLI